MEKDIESMKYLASEIDTGYNPLGFKIDKGADPLNRYTQFKIDEHGKWINGKPVCFHSIPQEGWIRIEKCGSMEIKNE